MSKDVTVDIFMGRDVREVPAGGEEGQILTKLSSGYGWEDNLVKTVNNISPDENSNIEITKTSLDLENVDNTSDKDKPISDATQTALNLKANTEDVYTKAQVNQYDKLVQTQTQGNTSTTVEYLEGHTSKASVIYLSIDSYGWNLSDNRYVYSTPVPGINSTDIVFLDTSVGYDDIDTNKIRIGAITHQTPQAYTAPFGGGMVRTAKTVYPCDVITINAPDDGYIYSVSFASEPYNPNIKSKEYSIKNGSLSFSISEIPKIFQSGEVIKADYSKYKDGEEEYFPGFIKILSETSTITFVASTKPNDEVNLKLIILS